MSITQNKTTTLAHDKITIYFNNEPIEIFKKIADKFNISANEVITDKSRIQSITFSNSMMVLMNGLIKKDK